METNYPRLEQPDLRWIKKFFWFSLGISTSLASVIWLFAVGYYLRSGENPFFTEGNHGNFFGTIVETISGWSLTFLLIYTMYTTVRGKTLAKRNPQDFTHYLPRMILLLLQVAMFVISFGACAILFD